MITIHRDGETEVHIFDNKHGKISSKCELYIHNAKDRSIIIGRELKDILPPFAICNKCYALYKDYLKNQYKISSDREMLYRMRINNEEA